MLGIWPGGSGDSVGKEFRMPFQPPRRLEGGLRGTHDKCRELNEVYKHLAEASRYDVSGWICENQQNVAPWDFVGRDFVLSK